MDGEFEVVTSTSWGPIVKHIKHVQQREGYGPNGGAIANSTSTSWGPIVKHIKHVQQREGVWPQWRRDGEFEVVTSTSWGPIVKNKKHVQREEYIPTCYSVALTAHLYEENQGSIPSSPIVVTIKLLKKKKKSQIYKFPHLLLTQLLCRMHITNCVK